MASTRWTMPPWRTQAAGQILDPGILPPGQRRGDHRLHLVGCQADIDVAAGGDAATIGLDVALEHRLVSRGGATAWVGLRAAIRY
ncbi:MAG: hypothetical protein R3D25_17885 [Geminicoccaceae bacterium]